MSGEEIYYYYHLLLLLPLLQTNMIRMMYGQDKLPERYLNFFVFANMLRRLSLQLYS